MHKTDSEEELDHPDTTHIAATKKRRTSGIAKGKAKGKAKAKAKATGDEAASMLFRQ